MLDAATMHRRVGLPEAQASWIDKWAAIGPPKEPVPVPSTGDIERLLMRRCGADRMDAAEIGAARPDPDDDPELWWIIGRCYHSLVSEMGGTGMIMWPPLPQRWGTAGRLVYLYAMLAAMPETLAFHERHGVSGELSDAIFADLGEKLRINRVMHGRAGLDVSNWFTIHFRGTIFQLGRLQFAIDTAGDGYQIGVHIPAEGGPMSPHACLDAVGRAVRFFPKHFGDRFAEVPRFTCESWLLDPQLAEHLPADSNIVAFQRMFELNPPHPNADEFGKKDVLRFVFGRVGDQDPAALPRDTSLRRVLANGFADGVRWQVRSGRLADRHRGIAS